jgi:hypothetical protein
MNIRQLLLVSLLGVTTGCMTHDVTYKVAVENRLSKPVTLWLVKDEGPEQTGWLSPEQVAESSPSSDDELPDVVLKPSETGRIGPLSGAFYQGAARASLRIYGGTPTLTQMLATGRGGLNRFDYSLQPGMNDVVIQERTNGGIGAKPRSKVTTAPSSPQP